ncbi:MAG: DNA double-strand break repair nuclease NurA [candidate division WOR-3 bacterium]
MHPVLYAKIIGLRERLLQLREELELRRTDLDVGSFWKTWHGKAESSHIAAGDGSFNYARRLGFWLFGATASGVYSGCDAGDVFLGELDILRLGDIGEDALRALAQSGSKIMEAKALKMAGERITGGLLLADGALSGLFKNYTEDMGNNRIASLAGLGPGEEERLFRWAKDIAGELPENPDGWSSWSGKDMVFSLEEDRRFSVGILMALCRKEYLATLIGLLDGNANRMVGIAKTSEECTIIEGFPDIYVLSVGTRAPGFTEPKPVELPKDEGLPELPCSFFYARLEEGYGVMRLEVFAEPEKVDPPRLLSVLLGASVSGYPYPLAKAHHMCSLSFSSLYKYLGLAGGRWEPSGREALFQ